MDKRAAWALVLGGIAAACGGEEAAGGMPCVTGTVSPCACIDGSASTQTCNALGTYDVCQCGTGLPTAGTTVGTAGTGAAGFTAPTGTAGTFVGTSGVGAAGDGFAGVMSFAGDGAAGAAGVGAAGSGGAGTGVSTTGADPVIPTVSDTCPTLTTGNITVKGQQVQLWVGAKQADKKGAVFFYWHGTGSNSGEAQLLGGALDEIVAEGGIVASFTTSTKTGSNTGNGVWYTGDFEMADVILKCATEQLNIDTRRIYVGGCSAGGLQAGAMVYGRSSYIAAAMPNSGGVIFGGSFQDPAHIPAVITVHGPPEKDKVGIDFKTSSLRLTAGVAAAGGMAVDCDHGGGHCMTPAAYVTAQWNFLKAHPFGVSPEPYASGLPGFPSGCSIQ